MYNIFTGSANDKCKFHGFLLIFFKHNIKMSIFFFHYCVKKTRLSLFFFYKAFKRFNKIGKSMTLIFFFLVKNILHFVNILGFY